MANELTAVEAMQQIDTLLSHVWMVRTFIKHSEEAEEDDELREVHRALYDFMLALGATLKGADASGYIKQAKKKIRKLREAVELYDEIQPEISNHTNFLMAGTSLRSAVSQIDAILAGQ
ncbi:MAG: cob(I)alamin adenosyltransferase [Pirellulaceae bacterium]|jgi:cob(I)alamin adenosyltransferase